MPVNPDKAHLAWLEALLNSIPAGVIVVELKTARILYANAAAFRFILPNEPPGSIQENAAAFHIYEERWRNNLYDKEGHHLSQNEIPAFRASRGEFFHDYEVNWKCPVRGSTYFFLCSGGILPSVEGREPRGIVAFVDITDRVKYREHLKQAITVREEFLSVAAHELKTPITSVMLQTQSLIQRIRLGSLSNEDIIKRLSTVERASQKLNQLVQELLDISHLGSPTKIKIREVDLCDILREAITRHEPLATRQGVVLRLKLPPERLRGSWDVDKLEQIITNLISNAMKYGNGNPVDVYLRHEDGHATLYVRDYGIGVPEESRERIFQRFERAVSSNEYAGMGIGLWLASEAAKSMGGTIDVMTPEEGPGSIFRLTLPIEAVEER